MGSLVVLVLACLVPEIAGFSVPVAPLAAQTSFLYSLSPSSQGPMCTVPFRSFVEPRGLLKAEAPRTRDRSCLKVWAATSTEPESDADAAPKAPKPSAPASAGATAAYMDKIPHHLRGLAIRKTKATEKDYVLDKQSMDPEDLRIMKELEEFEDENFDYAMELLELDDFDANSITNFTGDIDDAEVLKDLRTKMNPEDFREVFGRGVGDLL